MAFIMQDCINESELLDNEEKRKISELRYRARECGIAAEEVHLYRKSDGHIQAVMKVHTRWGNSVAMKDLTKVVASVLDLHMKPHKDTKSFVGKDLIEIIFEEEPSFYAVHGVARLTKDGAPVSGDNFSFLEKEDGELVLSLSDGMGFGTRACKESELVVDLLERFIEAGFTKETAIRMLNSAGVSFEIEIEQATKQLFDGDFLVMVTDGVLEYLCTEKPEETLEGIISEIKTNHPALLAKKILDKVMEYTGGEVRDDMTVLAAAVWEN